MYMYVCIYIIYTVRRVSAESFTRVALRSFSTSG